MAAKAIFVQHFDLRRHYLSPLVRLVYGNALKRCRHAVVFTEDDKTYAGRFCPSVTVIPLFGFDYSPANRDLMDKELSSSVENGELICVGSPASPRKNIAMLNEVAKLVKLPIHVYGPGEPTFKPCEYLILHGAKTESELIPIFARAKLLLLPSKLEGFSFALVQAMSVGLPFVSTPSSETMLKLAFGGTHGEFTQSFSPDDFATTLKRLYAADFDRARIIGDYKNEFGFSRFYDR